MERSILLKYLKIYRLGNNFVGYVKIIKYVILDVQMLECKDQNFL